MKIAYAVLVLSLAASPLALAQRACSKADAERADKALERVNGWSQLQKAVQDHGHCDSGPVGDGFTDAVLRLAVEWKNVDALAAAYADPKFKAFLVKHLKSPLAKDDAPSVYSRAKKDCPGKHEAFCAELAEVVKPAR